MRRPAAVTLTSAICMLLAVWLTFWGWVEDEAGFGFDGIDDWHWDNDLVDLIRWVGWIPIAMFLYRKIESPARGALRASRR